MKERPIIFNGEMVRAILEEKKIQTRRVIKRQDFDDRGLRFCNEKTGWEDWHGNPVRCPFGQPGDQLWVREAWGDVNSSDGPSILYRADYDLISWDQWCIDKGPDYGAGPSMNYDKYPGEYSMWWEDLANGEPCHKWRRSVHMPRWASRIQMLVKDVRVERLQDMRWRDCIAEGIPYDPDSRDTNEELHVVARFKKLWNSNNEKSGFGWDTNPWVWVVEFEKIEG